MTDLFRVVTGVGQVLALPFGLLLFGIALASPFMLVSVVKNVARMRRALERIADAHETGPRSGNGNVLGI